MQEEDNYKAMMNLNNAATNYMSACKAHEKHPTVKNHRAVKEAAKELFPLFRVVESFNEIDAISRGEQPDRLLAAKVLCSFKEE